MSVSSLTIHEQFENLTGRKMTIEENSQLRDILAQAPDHMEQSPSFVFNLLVNLWQADQLQKTIHDARKTILSQVEIDSGPATERLLQRVITKAHESSPSVERAFYKACWAGAVLFLLSFALAYLGLITLHERGYIQPRWFSKESYAKIDFAEAVQKAAGGNVDWSRREAPFDESLIAVLDYAKARGTNDDPYYLVRLYESCKYPGQVKYHIHGKVKCRYVPLTP